MSLDPSFVGRTYPPTAPYQVGREKIREFAVAIGATDPAYHEPEAAKALGHPDVIAPPTFPFVVAGVGLQLLIDDPGLGYFTFTTRSVNQRGELVCEGEWLNIVR